MNRITKNTVLIIAGSIQLFLLPHKLHAQSNSNYDAMKAQIMRQTQENATREKARRDAERRAAEATQPPINFLPYDEQIRRNADANARIRSGVRATRYSENRNSDNHLYLVIRSDLVDGLNVGDTVHQTSTGSSALILQIDQTNHKIIVGNVKGQFIKSDDILEVGLE